MKLLRLNRVPIFEQLRIEEAILRAGEGEWCLLNTGSPPAIVLGISGKPQELVNPSPLPLIRRFSGGGCVVVDESTLFITFIGEMPHPTPSKIHTRIETHLKPLFSNLPFSLQENDYVLGDKKFGGNAQYIAKNRYLHHSSLLWSFNPNLMSLLKMPSKTPKYRDGRSHGEFLTSLDAHFSCKHAFLDSLSTSLGPLETAVPEEIDALLQRPHRKSLSYISFNLEPAVDGDKVTQSLAP